MADEKWETWPPEGHGDRLANYDKYRLLFKGQHQEVFARVQKWLDKTPDKTLIYIVCNFAGLISKMSADFLFGEPFRVVVGDEGSKEQEAVNWLVAQNKLLTKCYEMALSNSWRGDAVFKIRFGKPQAWGEDQPIIEAQPPSYFFPDLNGDNIQEMTGATLAWKKQYGGKEYIRKEIHKPGLIRNELWLLDGSRIKEQVNLSTIPDYANLPEEQKTRYPGLLVEHVPNWRGDEDFWGMSDYADLESLFDAMNNRLSKIDKILDKHSDPKLVVPPGLMKYDPAMKVWYVEREHLDVIEVPQGEDGAGDLPKYIVWDAKLEAAFQELDKILELAMMMSETAPAAFGLEKGGMADSGRALKFRLIRTLAKINRKKLYFDRALKNALYVAQVLDVNWGAGSYEPKEPQIEWADGLPADPKEQAEIEQTRLASGNTSLESSVRRLDNLTGKALQEELERIQEDSRGGQGDRVPEPASRITLQGASQVAQGSEGAGGR